MVYVDIWVPSMNLNEKLLLQNGDFCTQTIAVQTKFIDSIMIRRSRSSINCMALAIVCLPMSTGLRAYSVRANAVATWGRPHKM